MADRYPLIANSDTKRIEELASGDNLNLSGNTVSGITTITASEFKGNLTGTADFAKVLIDGANILSGTISSERLAGYYPIQVAYASSVNAGGLIDGIVPANVLSGSYDIDITGTAQTAINLADAANITTGVINVDRLTGSYNIDITGVANTAISLDDAANINGGVISPDRLAGSYNIDITGNSNTSSLVNVSISNTTEVVNPNFSYGIGNTDIYVDDSLTYIPALNRLGLNTSSPEYNLDIRGNAYIQDLLIPNSAEISRTKIGIVTGVELLVNGNSSFLGIVTSSGLEVSGVSTFNGDLSVTGVVTANTFYGNLVGVASTSIDVIGGIGSLTQLEVSGVSTFNSGIFSGSTSGDLVRITQTGSGNAFVVEDSTSPDSTSFIVDSTGKVGIKTDQPNYDLDIKGTVLFRGPLYVENAEIYPKNRVGIISGTDRNIISGINTDGIEVSDYVSDGNNNINEGTVVVSIGNSVVEIEPDHNRFGTPIQTNFIITRDYFSGNDGEVLVSRGKNTPPNWAPSDIPTIVSIANTKTYYPILTEDTGSQPIGISKTTLTFIPEPGNLGIGSTVPTERLDVGGNINVSGSISVGTTATAAFVTATDINVSGTATVGFITATNVSVAETATATTVDALTYLGNGETLSGIVTQITAGIGVRLSSTQAQGKGVVNIDSYFPIGKTIFVTQNGTDTNSGLTESDSKRTIKAAAAIAFPGDTIKVYPGVYVEENPIYLSKRVAVEGTELRNCVVTPKYVDRDLFYVNNSCHITDLSFIGPNMTDGAAIVALQPLAGVSTDRYFDAARMIRYNLDYIARESVGFLTSGFSGFAGNHREQDAARLIDLNVDFIAAETIGFLTSTDYKNPAFTVVNSSGIATDPINCEDDIKDILRSISYDLKAGSNKKVIGAGLSYYDDGGSLLHITGTDLNGYSVKEATISAINHAVGIVTFVINNIPYGGTTYSSLLQDTSSYSPVVVSGGCTDTIQTIETLAGIVTSILDDYNNVSGITTIYGVNLESVDCADDIKDIWKCVIHDVTRGGNSRCVAAGKSYYDENWNLIPQILKNPGEVEQTIATVDYSFGIARAIINNSTWGGFPEGGEKSVTNAVYNNSTGITTITASNHGLQKDNAVKIVGLGFTCPSGPGVVTYPSGNLGYIFNVKSVVDSNTFEVVVGQSTLPHTYVSGGTVQKYVNFQNEYSQVKDLSIQVDPNTGFNNALDGCANVVSALKSCVGVVTTILGYGSTSGITTSFPGNSGIGFTTIIGITSAVYDNTSGETTILAPTLSVKSGDIVEIRDLLFDCTSGGSIGTQRYPSGKYGYLFDVTGINNDGSFVVNTGVSTIAHNYVGGGFVVNRAIGVTTASYDNTTGITTITAPGATVKVGQIVKLHDLEFSCTSGAGTTTLYPTGNLGYEFRVLEVIGTGTTFVVNTGVSTIPHTYEGGGVVFPPYSPGVGPITQGPYVRNCTNFVPGSIGMKVDGFEAEPGDQDDIGVTGTMSVDSYTQYNQGGIGVSITNGAYAQLVSIFTICDDIAIFTGSGGQCDITNSNSSFGTYGLMSDGVGDYNTKSIYHYTGVANTDAVAEQSIIEVSNIGNLRPYDGQTLHFGELYYSVESITVTDGGFGYTQAPTVTVDLPTGPNGIRAEAVASINAFGQVSSIDIISTGSQYRLGDNPQITISGPTGAGVTATASVNLYPIYYTVESATLPSSGISTVTLNTNLNNTVSVGTTVYFNRLSLQITSSHSFEWVGSGNDINLAKPALGGVVIQENEVIKLNGGEIVYTSTDQAGNFKIGDDLTINQLTGTISGRAFSQSILNTVTPLIIALGN